MAKVSAGKQLVFETADEVGMLAKVSKALADAGVNILAAKAYTKEGAGHFMVVTSDNAKTAESLKGQGIESSEKDVILLELENKVGALAEASNKLAAAGVNITHIAATAGEAPTSLVVLTTADNAKAMEVLG